MKFCIIANPEKYSIQKPLIRVVEWCKGNDVQLFITRELFSFFPALSDFDSLTIVSTENEAFQHADIVIALGGDGTMLHTAQMVKYSSKPVLGINTGRLGFMANIQPSQIEEALDRIIRDEFTIDKRDLL